MTHYLAFHGNGEELGSIGSIASFIGAGIALLVCFYDICCLFLPSWRKQQKWGRFGTGGPISPLGCAAWALAAATLALCLIGHGMSYQPMERWMLPVLMSAIVVIFAAGIGDSIYYRRRGAHQRICPSTSHQAPSGISGSTTCASSDSDSCQPR